MELTRREALVAAASFVAATALPKAMADEAMWSTTMHFDPPLEVPAIPRGLITPHMIVREMIFQLDTLNTELQVAEMGEHVQDPPLGSMAIVPGHKPVLLDNQKAVMWRATSKDLLLSLDDYSERFVEPAAKAIYTEMEDTAKRAELGKPVLVMARLPLQGWHPWGAQANWRGYFARLVRDYSINTDELLMRIDVLFGFTQA